MNFDLDENQQLFKAAVERFCAGSDTAARHAARRLPGGIDHNAWRALCELGLVAVAADEADGGLGGSLIDNAVVAMALGRGLAVEPWLECGFLAARLLAGSDHLAAVIAGDQLGSLAFAEPGRRFMLDAQTVRSVDGALNGEKTFVLAGGAADLFVVSAQFEGETRLFAVPRDTPGLEIRVYPVADGSFAATLALRQVAHGAPLPASFAQAIDATRIMAAAEMAGLAQRLFDDTLAFVKTREQFGQPLGRFQVIQHRLVDAYAKVENIQSSVWRALLQPAAPASATKAFVADKAIWVAQQAVQLHGGMGMTDELAIGHGLKRILMLSKLFGDPAAGFADYAQAA